MPGTRSGSAWSLPLAAHGAALAVLLLACSPLLHLGQTFTADEGAYALQVRALERGTWEYEYQLAEVDRDGDWLPLVNGESGEGGWYPYVKHPGYPLAMFGATKVVGEVAGLHLLGLLGSLGVAVAAWMLAGEIDARASRASFWVAAASPVTVNAYLVWAHAPAAAVAGFAAVAALRLVKTGDRRYLGALLALIAVGVLLRSEGLLLALALAGAILAVASPVGLPLRARAGAATACLAVAVGAAALEARWASAIVGGGGALRGSPARARSAVSQAADGWLDWVDGRLDGAWRSLLRGAHAGWRGSGLVLVALLLVVWSVSVWRRRRPGWERDVAVGLGVATLLYGARVTLGTAETMTGLVAAWPLSLLVLAAVRPPVLARLLVVVCVVYSAAVVATQYRMGGGFEWGGRFFLLLVAPMAVLVALGLRSVVESMAFHRRSAVGVMVALAVVPLVGGLVVVRTVRPLLGDVAKEVDSGHREVILTHSPALPPAAWRSYPRVAWALVPPAEMAAAVERLRKQGFDRLLVVVPSGTATELTRAGAVDVTGPAAARLGWSTLRVGV